jgi:hypothetical protein
MGLSEVMLSTPKIDQRLLGVQQLTNGKFSLPPQWSPPNNNYEK